MTYVEGGDERVKMLFDAVEGLSHHDEDRVRSHLIGGLACHVDDDTWRRLVSAALESIVLDAMKAARS